MQLQVYIEFDQLVQLAKKLPANQWTALKAEVESKAADTDINPKRDALKELLLSGPVFTKKQLEKVAEARKAINQWRTK